MYEKVEGDFDVDWGWKSFPPYYYGQASGIMLESYPAMDEVMERLISLPPEEQRAWGHFLVAIGRRLITG
jgi:hypothetical protein